jgi:hypothetical protein
MQWRPIKKKIKQTILTHKIIHTVLWDTKGILLVEFLPQGSTINAGVYFDTVKKLCSAIQNKQRGMFSRGVVMLHDNAHSHTATTRQDLIVTMAGNNSIIPLQP